MNRRLELFIFLFAEFILTNCADLHRRNSVESSGDSINHQSFLPLIVSIALLSVFAGGAAMIIGTCFQLNTWADRFRSWIRKAKLVTKLRTSYSPNSSNCSETPTGPDKYESIGETKLADHKSYTMWYRDNLLPVSDIAWDDYLWDGAESNNVQYPIRRALSEQSLAMMDEHEDQFANAWEARAFILDSNNPLTDLDDIELSVYRIYLNNEEWTEVLNRWMQNRKDAAVDVVDLQKRAGSIKSIRARRSATTRRSMRKIPESLAISSFSDSENFGGESFRRKSKRWRRSARNNC